MANIVNILQENYQKNLSFFKLNQINLYHKVTNFESKNIETYFIDFTNNVFNLVSNGKLFYVEDPFDDAESRVAQKFSRDIFSLVNIEKLDKNENKYGNLIDSIGFVNEYLKNSEFKNINPYIVARKFIFLGVGLGFHINPILNNSNYENILIIEPNIEIFRLSMFICDYTACSNKSKINFLVDFDEVEFRNSVVRFLEDDFWHNHFIPFEVFNEDGEYLVDNLKHMFMDTNELNYPFSEYLVSLQRGLQYVCAQNYRLINSNKNKIFDDCDVVFVGAGPSLDESRQILCEASNKCHIVATSASLKKLEQYAIVPDFIILLDGTKQPILDQFNVDPRLYKSSVILASIHVDEDVLSLFDKKNVFLFQDSLELFGGFGVNLGVNIGDVGIGLILKLGCRSLHLVGIDACLSAAGQTHSDAHSLNEKIEFDKSLFWVDGNFREKVPTTLHFYQMAESLNNKFSEFKDVFILNYSDGVKFSNTETAKKIKIANKKTDKNQIVKRLNSNIKSSCDQNDFENFKSELKSIQSVLNGYDVESNTISSFIYNKFEKLTMPYSKALVDGATFERQKIAVLNFLSQTYASAIKIL